MASIFLSTKGEFIYFSSLPFILFYFFSRETVKPFNHSIIEDYFNSERTNMNSANELKLAIDF